jgi:hypothetical protein
LTARVDPLILGRVLRRVRSPRSGSASRAGWLLLALALAAKVFCFAHLVAVPHAVCAYHDELVHGEAHAHAGGGVPADGPSWQSSPDRAAHEDHCGLVPAACARANALVPRVASELETRVHEVSVVQPVPRERAPSIPVYRLAPKTSPPRTA